MWLFGNGVQLEPRFLPLINGEQHVHFRSTESFPVLLKTYHGTQATLVLSGVNMTITRLCSNPFLSLSKGTLPHI